MTTFAEAAERIRCAATAADLGADPNAYRKWAKLVHPDAVTETDKPAATEAFAKLAELYANQSAVLHSGDIADLSDWGDGAALLKVPRSPGDNDLMAAEADALRRLRRDGDPKYRPYAPRLVESFIHEDAHRVRRTVNVIERLPGFVPVAAIDREIDPRDAAWIWRRLLTGLGWAHRAGVVHGAILPEHVLIHPGEHGVALVDWCYSGTRPVAVVKRWADAYPPEVRRGEAGPATDIYMATGLIKRLVGGRMPAALRRFADGCRFDAPRMRPQDAWLLLGELDELLHKLYGPRKFRPFEI